MAAIDIRRILGDRLRQELDRQGLSPERAASEAGLPKEVVEGYLRGERRLDFGELTPLCEALGQDLLWLASPAWKPSKVHFRGHYGRALREEVLSAERALSMVTEFIQPPSRPAVGRVDTRSRERAHLLMAVWERVRPLREKHPRVEDLYQGHRLPALPRKMALDGFLVSIGQWALVFVNRDRSPSRIEFTLLHEFAHYAFHPAPSPDDRIEIGGGDFYSDPVPEHALQEWVANKFAQLYLIPMDIVNDWAKKRLETACAEAARHVLENGISAEVAANALFDAQWLKTGRKPHYNDLRDRIGREIQTLQARFVFVDHERLTADGRTHDDRIVRFLEAQADSLEHRLAEHQDVFSEARWEEVKEGLFGER